MTVFGELKLYGEERTTQSMLSRPITAGTSTMYVQGRVDWQVGERIYTSSTTMYTTENDESIIDSITYHAGTDETEIEVEQAFLYYHEASEKDGFVMRARVGNLNQFSIQLPCKSKSGSQIL